MVLMLRKCKAMPADDQPMSHDHTPACRTRGLRRVSAVLAAATLAIGLVVPGPATAATTVPVLPAPAAPVFTAAIDALPAYQAQTLCTPTPKAGAVKLAALLRATYGPATIGISRACSTAVSEHMEGRALDWMFSAKVPAQKARAEAFLKWLLAPDEFGNTFAMARRLGVMYIGWNNTIFRGYQPERGWAELKGCLTDPLKAVASYDTYCHRNHVHISLSWEGASALTSFWSGRAVNAACPGPYTSTQPAPGAGADLIPITPVRVLDSRTGLGLAAPCRIGQLQWTGDRRDVVVQVGGRGGVPTTGVATVALRISTYWASAPQPTVSVRSTGSSLAWSAVTALSTATYASTTVVPVAADGTVRLILNRGSAELRVDVIGWAPALIDAVPADPAPPVGTTHVLASPVVFDSTSSPIAPGESRVVTVPDDSGIPSDGVTGLWLTVTTGAGAASTIQVLSGPTNTLIGSVASSPLAARSVHLLVPTTDGTITLRNSGTSPVAPVISAQGWLSTAASGRRLTIFGAPVVAVDTAKGIGLPGLVTTAAARPVTLSGVLGVPAGATAVLASMSAYGGSTYGTVNVTSSGTVAGVSFRARAWAHDLVLIPLDADGIASIGTASIGTGITLRLLGYVS